MPCAASYAGCRCFRRASGFCSTANHRCRVSELACSVHRNVHTVYWPCAACGLASRVPSSDTVTIRCCPLGSVYAVIPLMPGLITGASTSMCARAAMGTESRPSLRPRTAGRRIPSLLQCSNGCSAQYVVSRNSSVENIGNQESSSYRPRYVVTHATGAAAASSPRQPQVPGCHARTVAPHADVTMLRALPSAARTHVKSLSHRLRQWLAPPRALLVAVYYPRRRQLHKSLHHVHSRLG